LPLEEVVFFGIIIVKKRCVGLQTWGTISSEKGSETFKVCLNEDEKSSLKQTIDISKLMRGETF
jgi:hypothetical protein